MKLGPVTKLEKKDTENKIGDNFTSSNCDALVIFPNYGQFGAIRKPNCGCIICKTSLQATFYFTKSINRTIKCCFE